VLAGYTKTAVVICPAADSRTLCRRVQFLPVFAAPQQLAAIVAIVGLEELDPAVAASDLEADPQPHDLHLAIQRWRAKLRERHQLDRLLGDSPAICRARTQAELAAQTGASVLICGPAGSGRQRLAQAIHYASPEAGTMVPLACSVVGPELLSSTIRALLRADARLAGNRPTLLLNEIDQLPLELHGDLADLVATAGDRVRVISTSRRQLADSELRFNRRLAALLSTIVIELPALCDRLEDLPLLAQLFVEQANSGSPKQLSGVTSEALDRLAAYTWPGNVDELAEIIRQAHAQASGHQITPADLPARLQYAAHAAVHPRPVQEPIVLEELLGKIEMELIERALAEAKGNKALAARLLGMTRPRFYRRLEQLGLVEGEVEPEEDSAAT
jgi:DNA-binding NtrC family response regulator